MKVLKSVWFRISIALFVAGALLWWAIRTVSQDTYRSDKPSINNSVRSLLSTQAQEDKDNDGLKNWEEVLWNTSPSNADTDGDGTSDGEEVVSGRNPAVAGPNDVFTIDQVTSSAETDNENLTLTDRFAREFLSSYLIQKQAGGEIGTRFENEVLNKALDQNVLSKGKTYTKNDIRVSSQSDLQALKDYANALGKTFRVHTLPASAYDPLVTLQKAFENEDVKEVEKLEGLFETSNKIVLDLLATSVPEPLLNQHIRLLNAMSVISENFKGMSEGLTDPLKAVLHVQMYYNSSVAEMRASVKAIGDYLRQRGVAFQQGEDGSLIMNTI